MRWNGGVEGHNSIGQAELQSSREFAEGGSGSFSTFVAVFNPGPSVATVVVIYRHENGSLYSQQVNIGPTQRAVLGTPAWVPAGGFGIEVWSTNNQPVAAERMMYAGSNWTIGHASSGASAFGHTHWRFAEGASTGSFETYFLIANWAEVPATVTVTHRSAAGAVIGSQGLVIPAGGRGTVWANGVTGTQDFSTEVTSNQNVIAERAMYWPTGGAALMASPDAGATSSAEVGETTLEDAPLPSPYTLTEGAPGPVSRGGSGDEVVVGQRPPDRRLGSTPASGTTQSSSGVSWYGSSLAVGKRP